ncbi:MAG: TetR/AcrR family transcriptional regulator [Tannerellaceae bacterium]|nr:TetR/AcrR family transcriptional regulator [Tannerellaceae bacterium]
MQENSKDIESQILEAAKTVFIQKGYDATKMGDIAKEVGISRTALHYYFRTKETLFGAIFGQLLDEFLPNISLILEKEGTLLEKLPLLIDQYVTIISKNPSFPIFLVNEVNRDYEHLLATILKNNNQLKPMNKLKEQVLKEMEEGKLRKMPLLDIISTYVSLIVFPMLVRLPVTQLFFEDNKEEYQQFFIRRKEVIYDILYKFLAPERNKLT